MCLVKLIKRNVLNRQKQLQYLSKYLWTNMNMNEYLSFNIFSLLYYNDNIKYILFFK